jgi:hypothetical protein
VHKGSHREPQRQRGPFWTPITPLTGSFFHAETHSLLGLALGMAAYIPWTWIEWKSSGVDSGPPTESYLSFVLRWDFDPLTLVFLPAGLVTAAVYWRLGDHRQAVGG